MAINQSCGTTDFLNIGKCDNFATKHAWGILYPTSDRYELMHIINEGFKSQTRTGGLVGDGRIHCIIVIQIHDFSPSF